MRVSSLWVLFPGGSWLGAENREVRLEGWWAGLPTFCPEPFGRVCPNWAYTLSD